MPVRRHQQLIVWQRAMELVCAVYDLSRRLPREERFELASQMRRAAVSVPANIAEGHARTHRNEFLQYLAIAASSVAELETHLAIAERVGYFPRRDTFAAGALADEVGRMLTAMRRTLSDPGLARRQTLDT